MCPVSPIDAALLVTPGGSLQTGHRVTPPGTLALYILESWAPRDPTLSTMPPSLDSSGSPLTVAFQHWALFSPPGLGHAPPSRGGSTKTCSSSLHSAGEHCLGGDPHPVEKNDYSQHLFGSQGIHPRCVQRPALKTMHFTVSWEKHSFPLCSLLSFRSAP